MSTPNSDLRGWTELLRDGEPTLALKDRLDEIDRHALDSAVGFAAEHTRRYIATDGEDDGWRGPRPILILYSIGRRTGQLRRNPLLFVERNGVHHLIASNGGAEANPHWFLNVVAQPRVHVRVGAEVYAATASQLTSEERKDLWPSLVHDYPMFADYQAATNRVIPVVALRPSNDDPNPSPA